MRQMLKLVLVGASLVASSVTYAEGEEDRNAGGKKKSTSRLLEEVMVTAQRREENMQEVPISIQAFSNEKLDAMGVESVASLPKIVPGLTVTTQVGFTVTYLRGLGSDAFLFADPSVVNYTDGVYSPYSLGQTTNFGDVERIEVLKGPQGTLFGRNAIGGAVSITTKKPSLEGVDATFRVSRESYDKDSARGTVSFPLIEDKLGVSLSGIYSDALGHIDGRVNTSEFPDGEELPREETNAYRGKVLWVPTDWMEIQLNAYKLDQRGAGTLYSVNVNPSDLGEALGIKPEDPYKGVNNEDTAFEQTADTYYGHVSMFFDQFDLKFFGSDQYIEVYQRYDFDGSAQPIVYFEIEPGSSDAQTGEIQIISNDSSWGSDWLEWIVGMYYFESVAGFDVLKLRFTGTNLDNGDVVGLPLVPGELAGLLATLPLPTGDLETNSMLGTESYSYYSQVTVDFDEQFSLTLGGRYQEEQRRVIRSRAGLRQTDGGLLVYQDQSFETNPELETTTYAFSPKVTFNYRPAGEWAGTDALIFATWQQSTKSAAYNVINFLDFEAEKVLAEEIDAYEIGVKTLLFDDTLTLNASAFHYTVENPQVQIVSVLEGGVVNFENAGESVIQGFDIDILAQILPSFFNSLVLTANMAYLDTVYTDYKNGTGFDEDTGALEKGQDYSGSEVVRSPNYSGSVGLTQTFMTNSGPLELSVDYYYNDGFYYLASNASTSREESYGEIGARASYLLEDQNLRISAFGRNIGNAEYNISRFMTDFGALDSRAPLANYGLSLEWSFGR
ncbi:iron complex outermembrane receptor protein [Zhongshania antarctica]|uniref:Iron complex outermembrane receptor protein n=1 Tax=Zhongshania antarctica TaxID=641702 RepID=A0A840R6R5_9GAMM|nr:TonB-dependent receptor [Zhongshania antarctica]MBB5188999.1 iron complex outermembrane receptor protein [Zhongshania antarctica]